MPDYTMDEIEAIAKRHHEQESRVPWSQLGERLKELKIMKMMKALSAVPRVPAGKWLAPDEPTEAIVDKLRIHVDPMGLGCCEYLDCWHDVRDVVKEADDG